MINSFPISFSFLKNFRYRAEVLSVSNDQLTLRYVDYGNEDVVKFADTREMVDEFMKIPALSITCKLHDIREKDIDMIKAKKLLEDLCIENQYEINVIGENDGIFEVSMYDPELGESVDANIGATGGLCGDRSLYCGGEASSTRRETRYYEWKRVYRRSCSFTEC